MADTVFILHGIFRSSFHMRKLAAFLREEGFVVHNLDYPSTRYPLEVLRDIAWEAIAQRASKDTVNHLVGYSMGGLLVRAMLAKYRLPNRGRVVQLAAPNHGSEVADFVKNIWLYRWLYGPAGQELVTDQTTIAPLFGEVDYELGIIAGSCSVDPVSSLLLPGEHDGKVTVESTQLAGMTAHIVVPASHMLFPHNKTVQYQTAFFLKHGRFDQAEQVLP